MVTFFLIEFIVEDGVVVVDLEERARMLGNGRKKKLEKDFTKMQLKMEL